MTRKIVVEVAGFSGCALLVEGVREIYRPAAMLVAGVMLIAFAWAMVRGTL